MSEVSFTKAHGCGNDFLIVPGKPADFPTTESFVRAICDRHFGVGADGVYFLSPGPQPGADASVSLYNSDGSHAELSGNGTRCVAAVLMAAGDAPPTEPRLKEAAVLAAPTEPRLKEAAVLAASEKERFHTSNVSGRPSTTPALRIETGAGVKELRLVDRDGVRFRFRMQVGPATVAPGPEATLSIWLGNPQCVVMVGSFDLDWRARGRELTVHPFFPAGTNVDFVRVLDRHRVEARFWERGAGHTLASGTGSTASAVAAIHSGLCESPVSVQTEGGALEIEWRPGEDAYLTGPAEIICRGVFYC